jgi:hypothetical protein
MGLKIFLKQLLHTPDNNPLEMVESPNPGVYRPAVKVPDIEEVFGAIDETKVTDPDAAEASALGLLRGLLAALQAQAGDTNLGDLAALLTAISGKDFATQTTLAAVLSKMDTLQEQIDNLQFPANAEPVTPSDTEDLFNVARGIWVGGAGDVKVDLETGGTAIVFSNVPSGTILPIRVKRVYATDTTATNLVALY